MTHVTKIDSFNTTISIVRHILIQEMVYIIFMYFTEIFRNIWPYFMEHRMLSNLDYRQQTVVGDLLSVCYIY